MRRAVVLLAATWTLMVTLAVAVSGEQISARPAADAQVGSGRRTCGHSLGSRRQPPSPAGLSATSSASATAGRSAPTTTSGERTRESPTTSTRTSTASPTTTAQSTEPPVTSTSATGSPAAVRPATPPAAVDQSRSPALIAVAVVVLVAAVAAGRPALPHHASLVRTCGSRARAGRAERGRRRRRPRRCCSWRRSARPCSTRATTSVACARRWWTSPWSTGCRAPRSSPCPPQCSSRPTWPAAWRPVPSPPAAPHCACTRSRTWSGSSTRRATGGSNRPPPGIGSRRSGGCRRCSGPCSASWAMRSRLRGWRSCWVARGPASGLRRCSEESSGSCSWSRCRSGSRCW